MNRVYLHSSQPCCLDSSLGNALQGLARLSQLILSTALWFVQLSTQGQGLHSVFLPQCLETSLAFTLTLSECPRHAWDLRGGRSNDWCISIDIISLTKESNPITRKNMPKLVMQPWQTTNKDNKKSLSSVIVRVRVVFGKQMGPDLGWRFSGRCLVDLYRFTSLASMPRRGWEEHGGWVGVIFKYETCTKLPICPVVSLTHD